MIYLVTVLGKYDTAAIYPTLKIHVMCFLHLNKAQPMPSDVVQNSFVDMLVEEVTWIVDEIHPGQAVRIHAVAEGQSPCIDFVAHSLAQDLQLVIRIVGVSCIVAVVDIVDHLSSLAVGCSSSWVVRLCLDMMQAQQGRLERQVP